jgi:hypothetical protein
MEKKAARNEFLCPKKTSFWPKNKESYSTKSGEECVVAMIAAGANIIESRFAYRVDRSGSTLLHLYVKRDGEGKSALCSTLVRLVSMSMQSTM